jgi:hypothetical protein
MHFLSLLPSFPSLTSVREHKLAVHPLPRTPSFLLRFPPLIACSFLPCDRTLTWLHCIHVEPLGARCRCRPCIVLPALSPSFSVAGSSCTRRLPGRLLTFPDSFFISSLASQGLSVRVVPAYDMAENAIRSTASPWRGIQAPLSRIKGRLSLRPNHSW